MFEVCGSVCEGPLSIPESWLTSAHAVGEQLTANPVEKRLQPTATENPPPKITFPKMNASG